MSMGRIFLVPIILGVLFVANKIIILVFPLEFFICFVAKTYHDEDIGNNISLPPNHKNIEREREYWR